MILCIGFVDFKRIALENNKRIYYYQYEDRIDLYFISGGMIIKSFVDLNTIENKEVFFDDKLFFGATKLLFNIISDDTGVIYTGDTKSFDIITENISDERSNTDIQKESVSG